MLDGDPDHADAVFAHAYDMATGFGALPMIALILAERFLIAADREDWPAGDLLSQRAVEIVEAGHYDGYWTSALVFAAAARAAAHRGQMREARQYVKRAARLRPLLTYALPVVSAQALVELARAYVALVDPAGARAAWNRSRKSCSNGLTSVTLPSAANQLQLEIGTDHRRRRWCFVIDDGRTATYPAAAHSSIVPRDRRAAFGLPEHREEPGDLSYRKLGVSSRGEAVDTYDRTRSARLGAAAEFSDITSASDFGRRPSTRPEGPSFHAKTHRVPARSDPFRSGTRPAGRSSARWPPPSGAARAGPPRSAV